MRHYLYQEDFTDFELGEFPYDKGHSALGEYHYIKPYGYTGNWYDPISLHQWRSLDGSWLITSDGDKRYLEQNRGDNCSGHFSSVSAILVLKENIYAAYTMSFNIRLFSLQKPCGMVFNYISSRDYCSVSINNNRIEVYQRKQEEVKILGSYFYDFDDLTDYKLEVHVTDDKVIVRLEDKEIIQVENGFIASKCGVIGKCACRFSSIMVYQSDEEYKSHLIAKEKYLEVLKNKRSEYSKLEVIYLINLKNFGSGRQLRIANCDGEIIFVIAQHQKRMIRDSFAHLSCLTCFNLLGDVLWQIGEPNNSDDNTLISCDLPFQIADINNDGKLEVIYSMDFEVRIIDAYTGKLIKKMPTPVVSKDPLVGDYPYHRLNVDAIRVADFRGLGYKGDFIIKDRYKNVWAYTNDFELFWRYNHKNTGHFPFIYDFNNDGKDEMYVGYDYVSSDGEIIWSLPINSDHTDEILYLKTSEDREKRLYLASGNEGFNIVNMDGTIYKSIPVGHAQRISMADYNPYSKGLDICVTSFWGADGIIYMFDYDGNLQKTREMLGNGNVITPVNYDGKHTLILANSSSCGGLLDYELDTVVEFPDDGHPTLCCEVYDVDGDGVDEIICFDQYQMWIYKASKYVTGNEYEKYDDNAFSNYRGEFLIKK